MFKLKKNSDGYSQHKKAIKVGGVVTLFMFIMQIIKLTA